MPRNRDNWDGGDPWRNLAASVLLRALDDLESDLEGPEALAFLQSEGAQWYTNMLGIEPEALLAAAEVRAWHGGQSCGNARTKDAGRSSAPWTMRGTSG